jgi:N-methylhydantoinase A
MGLRVGVDTGGTFTDLCAWDEEEGRLHVHKVSSTPDDPSRAILDGVDQILDRAGRRSISDITYFAHGTTFGTNTLLTGAGVPTGLITTHGFRDLLSWLRAAPRHV